MHLKIENKSSIQVPGDLEKTVASIFQVIPVEHTRGLQRIVFVDQISMDARLASMAGNNNLPGLYHPKQGIVQPWALLPALP